ncbi:MAG: DsrE family protein [Alphaproteobacteria bacterium]|jgi:Predicted peroxiredoxins|nr:DsrE family protein [Alphaproteobacteria bacterium]MBU0794892.1 DsrE family protein [Alphaproteobacteria bacterium]MBU0875521.1 DsrE family protein [Alphaproteobacteria bacterium]MBU1771352.1 DsrE family protein [Alphaproteobacteria bacterium]
MSERPPLALIVVSADPTRLRAALSLARAEVALGSKARVFLQGEAAALLRPPISAPQDTAWQAAGEPALAKLLDEALDDGVAISLCQSGLAMSGITAMDIDQRVGLSGPIAFLAATGPNIRLLTL